MNVGARSGACVTPFSRSLPLTHSAATDFVVIGAGHFPFWAIEGIISWPLRSTWWVLVADPRRIGYK